MRNVILGYEQIPGVDYTESYAPLACDTGVKVTLAISLYKSEHEADWVEEMIDVEAAFLNSELDQEMYIELPDLFPMYCEETGLELPEDAVAQVIMSQYGCVQSARLWFMKFKSILLEDREVKQCLSKPCIF